MAEVATRSAERTLALLAVVCDRGRVSLSEAARQAELAPSTALRLLRTLEMSGFVRRDESGTFVPGGRIFQLGLRALSEDSLVDIVWPVMGRIVDVTGESVYLSARGNPGSATYIATQDGTRAVRHRSWTGQSIPLDGTAAGMALKGESLADGFAVVEGGVESESTAVAVPIRSGDRVLGALSLVAPTFRCTPEAIAEWGALLLRETDGLFEVSGPPRSKATDRARPGDVA